MNATAPKLLAVGFCIVLCCCTTTAQDETANAARTAESQGRTADAERLYLAGVSKAEAFGPSDLRLASALEGLGLFYMRQHKYSDVESQFKRAIDIRQGSEVIPSPQLRHDREVLAEVFQIQGRDEEAVTLYLNAVQEAKKSGKGDLPLAESLEDLGQFYEGRRDFEDAEPLFQRALHIKTDIVPPDDLSLTELLSKLVLLYQNADKPTQAEPFMLQKLNIEEKAFGAESANFAQEMGFLADPYQREGKYAEAKTAMKRSLDIRMKIDGPESGTVAFLFVRLANVATSQTNYSEAEQFYRKALAIQQKTPGANESESVLSTLSDLAKLYSVEGDYVQAEVIYEQILAAQMKLKPGSGQILGTVEQLGPIYEKDGKFGQAEVLYQKAVEVNQTVLPHGHLSLIGSLNDLALYYERRERLDEAVTYYKLALEQFGNPPSSDKSLMDSNRAIVLKNYARLLRKMNRRDEATQYEMQAKTLDEGLTPKPLVKK